MVGADDRPVDLGGCGRACGRFACVGIGYLVPTGFGRPRGIGIDGGTDACISVCIRQASRSRFPINTDGHRGRSGHAAQARNASTSGAVCIGLVRFGFFGPTLNITTHRGTIGSVFVTFGNPAETNPVATNAGERSSPGCDGNDKTHCYTRERRCRRASRWNGCRPGAPRGFGDGAQRRSPHRRCETNISVLDGRETARRIDRCRGPDAHSRLRIAPDAGAETHFNSDGTARAPRAAGRGTTDRQSAASPDRDRRHYGARWRRPEHQRPTRPGEHAARRTRRRCAHDQTRRPSDNIARSGTNIICSHVVTRRRPCDNVTRVCASRNIA